MITTRQVSIPTILEDGQIQLREDTVYEEDGKELFRKHHRKVLEPGQDVTQEDARIRAIAKAVWTAAVVDEYKRKKEEREAQLVSR